MADEIEIRPFHPDDTEALWRLARQPSVLATTMALPSLRLEQRRERYEHLGDDDHVFVAVRHGEVAGSAGLHVGAGRRRHTASLGIGVSMTHQRAGVGDLLMQAVLDLADRWLGLRRIELGVLVDNEPAVRLYEKHGFVREGLLRQSIAAEGELRDELRMARLRPAMPAAEEVVEGGAEARAEAGADAPAETGAEELALEAGAEAPGGEPGRAGLRS